jgi:hypothetical protein
MERHIQTICLILLVIPNLIKGWRSYGNWFDRQHRHWKHIRSKLDEK